MSASSAVSQTTAPSFDIDFRMRFQDSAGEALPLIVLDREGNICNLTRTARHLLEYSQGTTIDECFFSHVHKRNMHRVMKNLADMVSRGKQQAEWLVRLYTGNNRWRWYRVEVQNHLGGDADRIYARLRSV